MAINYPGSLDNFTNPTSASPINSPSHADQHSNANDAIEALEAKVGSNNSVVTTSHDYKIAQLESLVTSSVAGAKSIYQDVRNQSGSAFTKATPVYVSGSEGASGKMLISAASNASEATSSKTMGITTSAISNNSNGQVISEGILEGIDTTGAADGDPVWLGVNGAKIYGLVNKPSAPAHLVFLGIVIRGGQANTGSMYVKIQNGFELQEIHNVELSSLVNGNILTYDSTTQTWKNTNTLQSTSSTVPLVIKGADSQTANLTEWKDGSGNLVGYINNGAGAWFSNSIGVSATPYAYSAMVSINTANAGNKGLVIRGFASQTANLQEWQGSTGAVAAKVASNGAISSISGGFFGTASGPIDGGNYLAVRPWAANHIPFTVKGYAAQTADLTRWVNDAGTTLASVTSNGGIQAGTYNGVIISLNYPGIVIDTSNADNTQVWLRNLSATSKSGKFVGIKARPGYADAVSGDDLVTLEGQQYISSLGYASGKILISNDSSTPSATSYPARITFHTVAIDSTTLTERMRINNAGLVGINMTPTDAYLSVTGTSSKDAIRVYSQSGLAFWGAGTNNNIYSSGSMYLNGGDFAASARLIIGTGGASNSGIVVRGVASQTAALQEWQNSSGTMLASITDTGFSTAILRIPYIYTYSIQGWNGVGGSIEFANETPITIKPQSASVVNLVIKGAVSQSADLQQWQDSSGTALAGIGPNGRIYAQGKTGNTDDLLYLRRADNNINFYVDKDATLRGNFSIRLNQEPTIDTQAYMWSGTAARSALGVSGTGSTNPTFYAKATASQTSNLTEWQDSSGNAKAYVRYDGFINTNSSIRIAGDNLSVYRFQGVSDGNYTMNFPGSGNIQLFSATDSLGGGSKVLGISNATTVPSSNPTGGGILYVSSGALNYMGTSNTPQQIVGADGSVKFTSPTASTTPLIIQHTASPTSSYFEIRNSAGNPVWGVNSSGEALTRTTTKFGANIQNDSNNNNAALALSAPSTSGSGIALNLYSGSTTRDMARFDNSGVVKLTITSDGSFKGGNSSTISANTATTVDTVALSSFTTIEYTISIKQGSKIRSSKVLVHTDGTSVDSTEYGIMEMGGGITGILVTASVSSTNSILQVTITDAATTNATVKLIKTML